MMAASGGLSPSLWWAEPLAAFADAFDVQYEVLQEPRTSVRSVGEWWMLAEQWHVQLDKYATARFAPGEAVNEGARRLLTVALVNGQGAVAEDSTWREVLTRYYSDMVLQASQPGDFRPGPGDFGPGNDGSGDYAADGDYRLIQRMSIRELSLPGCFASIEFTGVGPDVQDFRAFVQDIFVEFEPTEFLGWTAHPHNAQSALVFVSYNMLMQSMDSEERDSGMDETSADARASENHANVARTASNAWMGQSGSDGSSLSEETFGRASVVHKFFAILLGTLESEAMARAKATVGCIVSDSKGWLDGLASVIQAWREHYWFAEEESVYIWGQRPVLFLLSSLPTHAIAEFIQMARVYRAEGDEDSTARSLSGDSGNRQSPDIHLSAELSETLEGFLRANLNVSEASRILYLHRNTLMNRLDRIRTQTGYDVRRFEDAQILWLVQGLLGSMKDDGDGPGKKR